MLIRRSPDEPWREPAVSAWQNEDTLQQVLESAPELLPGFVGRRLVAAREVSTRYGPADLFVLDEEGNIAIVEVKLERNAEIKRKVIGQLLEYASSVWRDTYEDFEAKFSRAAGRPLEESVRAIASGSGDTSWSSERFRAAVEANLAAGRFHLVFAVDAITPELKDVVEYLNTTGGDDLSVLALELRYVRDGDVELLVPDVYGVESVRRKAKARGQWDREQVFAAIAESHSPEASDLYRELASWSEEHGAELVTGTGRNPTMNAWFPHGEGRVRVWYLGSNGSLSFILEGIRSTLGPEVVDTLLSTLRAEPAFVPSLIDAERKTDTSIPAEIIVSRPGAIDVVESALAKVVTLDR